MRSTLAGMGYTLLGPSAAVTTLDEAQAAAAQLKDAPLDLLLIYQATFADSSMVLALVQQVDAPMLLWAVPEAATGGRLRLNSLCGINLAGHALTRAGFRYAYTYANPTDEAALEKLRVQAAAGRVRRKLRGSRIGRIGENPSGFETCLVNRPALRDRLGIDVVDVDLRQQVFEPSRAVPETAVDAAAARLDGRVAGLTALDTTATRGTLRTYLTLNHLAQTETLQGMAVRCWPEFFTELGCAACGAMSMLSDEQIPASCEADVNGTITQYMLQLISGEPAFGSDIVSVDRDLDALIIWHCGLAPLSMADTQVQPGVTIHSNRKLPLLMDFSLKPGVVTIARLSEATGTFRLVIGRAEIVRGEKPFSGTCGFLRFERGAEATLDCILSEGLEHHISLTYGDHRATLQALAHMLDIPVLQL
ncbi:MAG: L-fucose/L-arabinose isomerase family protein [Anaerolineae bacterium]|nr:L-fucose/L-arabinose isomerase family protein [Anaerolineae bacterium]